MQTDSTNLVVHDTTEIVWRCRMADGTWLVSHTFQPSDVITIDRVWQRRIPQAGGYELIQIMIDFRLAGRP